MHSLDVRIVSNISRDPLMRQDFGGGFYNQDENAFKLQVWMVNVILYMCVKVRVRVKAKVKVH